MNMEFQILDWIQSIRTHRSILCVCRRTFLCRRKEAVEAGTGSGSSDRLFETVSLCPLSDRYFGWNYRRSYRRISGVSFGEKRKEVFG